jgi:C-terminal processing protease CtpA/Prc
MDYRAHSRTRPCKVRPGADGCQRIVSGPDKLGVGLFFRHQADDGSMRVISIVPGSSAHKSGVILTGDKLIALDEESVFGWSLQVLRQRLHGTPGSIVTLDLENPDGTEGRKRYRINLTR